jgi:hypothetical protein
MADAREFLAAAGLGPAAVAASEAARAKGVAAHHGWRDSGGASLTTSQ